MFVVNHKYWFLGFSTLLVLIAVLGIAKFGLVQGIDFVGGTLWQVQTNSGGNETINVKNILAKELKLDDVIVVPEDATKSLLIRSKNITETEHQQAQSALKKAYKDIKELRFETLGPTIGSEIRRSAIWAFIFVLLGISLYVAYAFRTVSYPVSSWKYGVITLLTLFHDAIIPAGLFAIVGHLYNAEIDTNFVVAILVVMGFSVHDTIVVFDRIRENLRSSREKNLDFHALVGKSINETMARSINTSLTLIIVLVGLALFGATSLFNFVGVILVGTIVGTYSSICVASPLLTLFSRH